MVKFRYSVSLFDSHLNLPELTKYILCQWVKNPVLTELYPVSVYESIKMIVPHLEYILPMVIHHICHFISQCSGLTRWLTPILTFRFDMKVPRGALLQTAGLIGGYEGLAHSLVSAI